MTDEKREHWAALCEWDGWNYTLDDWWDDASARGGNIAVVCFPTVEARDAALRDLEACPGLKASLAHLLNYCHGDVCPICCEAESDDGVRHTPDCPVPDAILSALGGGKS